MYRRRDNLTWSHPAAQASATFAAGLALVTVMVLASVMAVMFTGR